MGLPAILLDTRGIQLPVVALETAKSFDRMSGARRAGSVIGLLCENYPNGLLFFAMASSSPGRYGSSLSRAL
jgi:hypothetical protein